MYSRAISQRRSLISLNSTEDSTSHSDAQRQFAELLTIPMEGSTTNNDITHKNKKSDYIEVIDATELYNQIKNKLSTNYRNERNELRWCLTNGPLAGMIIEALQNDREIIVTLNVNNLSPCPEIDQIMTQINKILSHEYGGSIIFKVDYANTSI